MTDGSTNEPAEQAKKSRKSRANEPASDDLKAGSSDPDPVQDADDGGESEKDDGTEQSGGATTTSEPHVAEKHEASHGGTGGSGPGKNAGTDGDKTKGSDNRSVYTHFRRSRR
jgi:hypothetical protein